MADCHTVHCPGNFRKAVEAELRASVAQTTVDDWKDDPSADERWNAGVDCAMKLLCDYLGVDPNAVTWDAATETVDGDISAVIGNILRSKFCEDWSPVSPTPSEPAQTTDRHQRPIDRDTLAVLFLNMWTHGNTPLQIADEFLARLGSPLSSTNQCPIEKTGEGQS
jgi:hypothetical protein